jgi:glutamine synthetase
MSDVSKVFDLIKENDVSYVDFRFTDPRGKWQHLAMYAPAVEEDTFSEGVMFDGSSIEGWKAINESDMCLMPDAATAVMDPFAAQPQLIVFCDVLEPETGQPYNRDPRSTARKAEAFLQSSGAGDTAVFGPEAEFFVFDDVQFGTDMHHTFFRFQSEEGPYMSGRELEEGNLGHRPGIKGGYFPVPPVDSGTDLRAEMTTVMAEMGLTVEKHHHEVAPSQHELGIKYNTLLRCADEMQIYKYVVQNVAHSYGKTATFMPKPVYGDNGSGMHIHQSIWKGGNPLFAGNGYAGLSEEALYYIGGIIKHARAINAFSNPSTNSYKRLVPGFEAPVLLAYSGRNRSAACRIPYGASPNAKRVEVRFPDPTANPYLTFAAMLMAGLDGIRNRIHPGDPMDKNLYDLPPEELQDVPTVCGYMELKWEEIYTFEHAPHPIEFKMYYSS